MRDEAVDAPLRRLGRHPQAAVGAVAACIENVAPVVGLRTIVGARHGCAVDDHLVQTRTRAMPRQRLEAHVARRLAGDRERLGAERVALREREGVVRDIAPGHAVIGHADPEVRGAAIEVALVAGVLHRDA